VFVGRPSKWGNPFVVGINRNREAAVAEYAMYLRQSPSLTEEAKRELKGKDLVCFCHPLACHADILLEVANEGADV